MMPARYHAPAADLLLDDENRFEHWRKITDAYAHQYIEEVNGSDDADRLHRELNRCFAPTPQEIRVKEQLLGHDVVAFLDAYTSQMSDELKPYIHHGLTSSDLVEYGLFRRCHLHLRAMLAHVQGLAYELEAQVRDHGPRIRPGRTHGQIADHSSWSHTLEVSLHAITGIQADIADMEPVLQVVKWAGPTGWDRANPQVHNRGRRVADYLDCVYVIGTQVVHRDLLLRWACLYLRLADALENLAMQVRLAARADVAEVKEGARGRVGSSAMPHKVNPIGSEKICGLAKVARGYFTMISEDVALWEDRDISNSSLERVAVMGLGAVVEHMTTTMHNIMKHLVVDANVMNANASDSRTKTNLMQTVAQEVLRLGPIGAGELIRGGISRHPNFPDMWITDTIDDITAGWGVDLANTWANQVEERWAARFSADNEVSRSLGS